MACAPGWIQKTYLRVFQNILPLQNTKLGNSNKLTIAKIPLNGRPEELVNTLKYCTPPLFPLPLLFWFSYHETYFAWATRNVHHIEFKIYCGVSKFLITEIRSKFFIGHLVVPTPTLGHWQKRSFLHLMLITLVSNLNQRSQGHL